MRYTVSPKDIGTFDFGRGGAVDKALRDVAAVLATPKGSVPLHRAFGIDADFLDRPMPAALQLLRSSIREAVELWVPAVTVVSVDFETDEAAGRAAPVVEVEIDAESGV